MNRSGRRMKAPRAHRQVGAEHCAGERALAVLVVALVVGHADAEGLVAVHRQAADEAAGVEGFLTEADHQRGGDGILLNPIGHRIGGADVDRIGHGGNLPGRQRRLCIQRIEGAHQLIAWGVHAPGQQCAHRRHQTEVGLPIEKRRPIAAHIDAHLRAERVRNPVQHRLQGVLLPRRQRRQQIARKSGPVRQLIARGWPVADATGVDFKPVFEREDGAVAIAEVFLAAHTESRALHDPAGQLGDAATLQAADLGHASIDDAVQLNLALRPARRRDGSQACHHQQSAFHEAPVWVNELVPSVSFESRRAHRQLRRVKKEAARRRLPYNSRRRRPAIDQNVCARPRANSLLRV